MLNIATDVIGVGYVRFVAAVQCQGRVSSDAELLVNELLLPTGSIEPDMIRMISANHRMDAIATVQLQRLVSPICLVRGGSIHPFVGPGQGHGGSHGRGRR